MRVWCEHCVVLTALYLLNKDSKAAYLGQFEVKLMISVDPTKTKLPSGVITPHIDFVRWRFLLVFFPLLFSITFFALFVLLISHHLFPLAFQLLRWWGTLLGINLWWFLLLLDGWCVLDRNFIIFLLQVEVIFILILSVELIAHFFSSYEI